MKYISKGATTCFDIAIKATAEHTANLHAEITFASKPDDILRRFVQGITIDQLNRELIYITTDKPIYDASRKDAQTVRIRILAVGTKYLKPIERKARISTN